MIVAEFIPSAAGRIFVLLRRPIEIGDRGCVLFVPPFGEEMNKSRRQITLTAERLVNRGFSVLTVDLYGTGDSEGDFSEATWDVWKADIANVVRWCETAGPSVDSLVGVRLGCALAGESLRDGGLAVQRTVFWQPVDTGRQYISQFLRLRVAASMMSATPETVDELRARLAQRSTVEVAGYCLSPTLWEQIERVETAKSVGDKLGRLAVLELGLGERRELSPGGRRVLEAVGSDLGASGARIHGEPFWGATEIVVNSELSLATVQFLSA
jgi:exosortase A-associated hydrolase 2